METQKNRWVDPLLLLLSGVLTFAVCALFAPRGIDPHHDGIMLKTAVDVSRGLVLYRDTFTQYGPLVHYTFALAVKLFGETVLTLQYVTCALYALSAMLLYRIVHRYAPLLPSFLAPLFAIGLAAFYFWNFHPWSSVFALLLSLLACELTIRYTETRRPLFAALSGAVCAGMFWCRTPSVITLFCGALYLLGLWAAGAAGRKETGRALASFALGAVAISAVFLGVLLAQGALADFGTQYIGNAFTFATEPTPETAAGQPDNLFTWLLIGINMNPKYDWVWRVLTHGSLLYCIVLLVRVFRKKKRGGADAATLGCLCFAAFMLFNWPHYYPTLCYRHVFWSDYGMVGVLTVALCRGLAAVFHLSHVEKLRARGAALAAVLTSVLMLLLLSSNFLVRARLGKARLLGGGTGADFRTVEIAERDTVLRYARADYPYLNGLYLSERETRFYDGLFDTLSDLSARYPEKNIVNLTPNALFSVFSSDNPHKHAFALFADGYPEQTEVVARYIAENKPIVLSYTILDGYAVEACLTDYNGDEFRYEPMYVLAPTEGESNAAG